MLMNRDIDHIIYIVHPLLFLRCPKVDPYLPTIEILVFSFALFAAHFYRILWFDLGKQGIKRTEDQPAGVWIAADLSSHLWCND